MTAYDQAATIDALRQRDEARAETAALIAQLKAWVDGLASNPEIVALHKQAAEAVALVDQACAEIDSLRAQLAEARERLAEGRRHVESAMLEKRVAIKAALESRSARDALRLENASLVDAAHRSRADLLEVQERRDWLEDEYAIANRHISKLAHIVVTARHKLEYLLRDYPDDNETRALCAEIDRMTGKEAT